MPFFAFISHLLVVLSLTIPLLASAQSSPPMTDAERARRDAEKVFSFIKFQTVRSKPMGEAAAKPPKPPAAPRERPASPPTPRGAESAPPTVATTPLASPAPAPATEAAPVAVRPIEPNPQPTPAAPAVASTPAAASPGPGSTQPEPEQEDDDEDDAALQLQSFVPPSLSPEVNATLGAGSRNVKVRFTVEPNGSVSKAEAAAGVPRRLAKPATDAILQWRFAPLPQARNVDVEIAFRRD
jgi:outer membrane biosynthesis protein TonB